jgi:hypothetical protein
MPIFSDEEELLLIVTNKIRFRKYSRVLRLTFEQHQRYILCFTVRKKLELNRYTNNCKISNRPYFTKR